MRLSRVLPAMFILCLAAATPARADATLFLGTITTPSSHATKGFAIGVGLIIVGVEFEYASASEDVLKGVPSLRTGMGNAYVQTPIPIGGVQFYATTGGTDHNKIRQIRTYNREDNTDVADQVKTVARHDSLPRFAAAPLIFYN